MKTATIRLSPMAMATIKEARLPGETDVEVIDRLLVMLLPYVGELDTFFGKQVKEK